MTKPLLSHPYLIFHDARKRNNRFFGINCQGYRSGLAKYRDKGPSSRRGANICTAFSAADILRASHLCQKVKSFPLFKSYSLDGHFRENRLHSDSNESSFTQCHASYTPWALLARPKTPALFPPPPSPLRSFSSSILDFVFGNFHFSPVPLRNEARKMRRVVLANHS